MRQRMLHKLLVIIAIVAVSITRAGGREGYIDPDYYIFPIEGVARQYAATFGEFRPDHLHSGVDIKSDGVEGKRIVAPAQGYVSRISLSTGGFGLAIYLAHPNGTTTLFAHLSKLRPDLHKYLEDQRYEQRKNTLNIYPEAGEFPVAQGDLIGYSGNTGNSFGPHLHYEVRESREQRPLNPVTLGIITPKDSIKPTFVALYYAETHTIDGVSYPAKLHKYVLSRGDDGDYTIKDDRMLWVGREGYFIVEVTDRKEGVSNTFGIYSLRSTIDNKLHYLYQQDGFRFDQTRYKNAISYYPYQIVSNTENYRLCRLAGLSKEMLLYARNDGVIYTKAGEQHAMEIEACDDMGNRSTLRLSYRGKDDKDCFQYTPNAEDRVARYSEESHFKDEGLEVAIPKGALYESIIYRSSSKAVGLKLPEGVEVCSPQYSVLDYHTPLHRAMSVTISAEIEAERQPHATMVYVNRKGEASAIGGKFEEGRISAKSSSAGSFFVAVDSVAPTIKPLFKEGDKMSGKSLRFEIDDNFSGVSSYKATVDGEWVALDRSRKIISYTPRGEVKGRRHTIEVTISDLCGNTTTKSFNFKR